MKHASPNILSDLAKLNSNQRAEIKRVAGADLTGSSPLGASRVLPARDMDLKVVSETQHFNTPSPNAPPTSGSTKPLNTPWPTNPCKLESGLARPGRLDSMPSRVGPSK
jgi:hypothetical protein